MSRALHPVAVAMAFLAPAVSLAQVSVIGPGREADVLALLQPHTLGEEVVPGWTLDGVSIEPRTIDVRLRAADGEAQVVLHHVGWSEDERDVVRTASFAIEERGAREGAAARGAIVSAVREQDDGTFWEDALVVDDDAVGVPSPRSGASPWPTVLVAAGSVAIVLAALFVGRRQRGRAPPT